ncbi:hypothetical protein BJ508DRAFT_82495 [Ascobolus immersus RN42]|uniref:Uncharacterized protein n=1 Tax=Ascobolus immersus RN42 TaxID=1160509 RepID=A0A3N4HFN6_ASCIM|nr:hypothetical protein BJ508DRAFT_82495 [Ascobolus immersus RN42]
MKMNSGPSGWHSTFACLFFVNYCIGQQLKMDGGRPGLVEPEQSPIDPQKARRSLAFFLFGGLSSLVGLLAPGLFPSVVCMFDGKGFGLTTPIGRVQGRNIGFEVEVLYCQPKPVP